MPDFANYLNIRSAHSPVLSPDGSRVAFLTDITGTYQVWSAPTAPGACEWPRQLTFFADKVWEVHGTRGAAHLLAVGDVGGNERQQFYLISGYGGGEEGHDVRRLTPNDDAIHRFGAFSQDGQGILYTSNQRNGTDFDLYVLNIPSGNAQCVCELSGNRYPLGWNPAGTHALIAEGIGPLQTELFVVEMESGRLFPLTAEKPAARYGAVNWRENGLFCLSDLPHDRGALCLLDGHIGELTVLLSPEEFPQNGEFESLKVSPDGSHAAFTFNAEGYSQLHRLDVTSGSSTPVESVPGGQIGGLSVGNDGTLLFDLRTPDRNPDVWLMSPGQQPRQITHSDRAGLARSSFVSPELIRYDSFDGLSIPAFYYLPQTPRPEGGYPCILYVHGGPSSQLRPDFDVRFQYFLSRGYAILGTNVRGSTGYGRTFTGLDEIEKRMDSVADLKHAVEWLRNRAEIDGQRIAVYGRSYGGFMVLAALTEYPELFAAGIDVVGIANWVSFLERTSSWRRANREAEYGSLAHHRDVLERISPIHKADRITMPLLVIAGDNDPRVPLFESEQIVEKVGANGGVVEFLHYADEGHSISKLPNRIDSFSRMAAFLDKHL